MGQWVNGSMDQWINGSMVQWINGSIEQSVLTSSFQLPASSFQLPASIFHLPTSIRKIPNFEGLKTHFYVNEKNRSSAQSTGFPRTGILTILPGHGFLGGSKRISGYFRFPFTAIVKNERMHMLKLVHYINDRSGHGVVPACPKPPKTFDSVPKIFEHILQHERQVTKEINNLVDACLKEKDYTTHNFLQWYVAEQIEEENLARQIIDKRNLIGNDKGRDVPVRPRPGQACRQTGQSTPGNNRSEKLTCPPI
jgi:ferritin